MPDGTMTADSSMGEALAEARRVAASREGIIFYLLEFQLSTRTEAARITTFLPWASTTRTRRGAAGPGEAGGDEAGDGDLRPGSGVASSPRPCSTLASRSIPASDLVCQRPPFACAASGRDDSRKSRSRAATFETDGARYQTPIPPT